MKRGDIVFEWDEAKRERTRLDRGFDFTDAPLFFDGRKIVVIPSPRDGEERWRTIAKIEGAYYALIWMWRGDVLRVISMRRAHGGEERAHRTIHGE
ncbi:BrnT family toxin [Afifella sp. YEN Y35]|uniref:BrnT family toxin n=1 Tax=Afifella sp. YEN Y35 TaxID=3388337 RepID=UPI0039DFBE72